MGVFCFSCKTNVETNLLKTLLPQDFVQKSDIVPITNKTSSVIKVVFESESESKLEKLTADFNSKINKDYFKNTKPDISELLNKYLSSPYNFLSDNSKILLERKEYNKLYNNALSKLYNPTNLLITDFDKDPYLLFDDFILSNKKIFNKLNYYDNKYYDSMQLRIVSNDGLSPDLANKEIKELINIQKQLSDKSSKIYLAGTPIHSYYTSKKSIIFINIICILSSLLIIFLTCFFFRSLKPLIPISLSIFFGMLLGYCAVKFLFNDFQIITMVFSTTLIGIGIDYSYHYFFKSNDKIFFKNLFYSFLTSVIPFALLYLTKIEFLKQIAIFTIFGLFGIYLVVLFIYPCFDIKDAKRTVNLNFNLYKISLCILAVFIAFGILKFRFNDSLSALYTPSKKLLKAEKLYSEVSGGNFENAQIILVQGEDIQNTLEKEEKLAVELNKNKVEYISLSKFIPSFKTQEKNFKLVKNLYADNLDNFKDILSDKQIKHLKNSKFKPVYFNIEKYPFLKDFLFKDNNTLIFAFSDSRISISDKNIKIINFKNDIEQYMKKYRQILMLILPVVIFSMYILLAIVYDFKKALKIMLPLLSGVFCALTVPGELNLFSIISIFILLGFTIDYSIFRMNKDEKTEDAIFISSLTTSFSFLLLSFCGFKLLASMAAVLFFGILTSYIVGYFVFRK